MPPDRPPLDFRTILASPPDQRTIALLSSPLVRALNAKYRPWRKVRAIARDAGQDPIEIWKAVKLSRLFARSEVSLHTASGDTFGFSLTPALNEELHRIDQACGGGAVVSFESPTGLLSDPAVRERFIIRTMMEEAIESSRIEGAATTRELALDLLRSGRKPRTEAELMVANNYDAMERVKTWLNRPLTPEMCCELQAILTRDTLKHAGQGGRFRRDGERVAVVDDRTSQVTFVPPPASELPHRMAALCTFANREHGGEHFIHPIVKASILHFMVGYEHPFVDGNGRTARAVFYWYALKSGYRAFEYMAISELIRAAYARYPHAFIDTETDDNDLTYFIQYKLGVIHRAVQRLLDHLREEERKINRSLRLVRVDSALNLRQRLLLEHALRHPKTIYTAKSHARSNNISAMTARTDLEHLRERGLLTMYRAGREGHYMLSPDLPRRLAGLAEPGAT